MLELNGVSSQYEEKVLVLRNISMFAREGITTCVLGPNGAGKSTLVKTIVNIIRPKTGQVLFSKIPIEKMKTHRIIKMGISVVPEERQLFPKLTVEESLRLGAYFENNSKVIYQRMEKAFELFPILKERLVQLSGTLSGGELGMLSIARSLMSEPKMIILDEPSIGLSPLITSRVFTVIKDINDRGVTILLIEQNAKKSLSISSYGYLLQKGEIIGEGEVESLKQSDIVKKAYLRGK